MALSAKSKMNMIIVAVILLLALIVGLLIMLDSILADTNPISGEIVSYDRWDGFWDDYIEYPCTIKDEGKIYFNMSDSIINDIVNYKEKYSAYWINTNIRNVSSKDRYNLQARLNRHYSNLWFDTSSLSEGTLNLLRGEEVEASMLIIIKTENMPDYQIDELIRSLIIDIYYSYYDEESILSFIRKRGTVEFTE